MLGELQVGEKVFQLAILEDEVPTAGRLQLFVNDENGRTTKPLKVDKVDFDKQFRPWGGYKNVYVRAVQVIAFENNGQLVRFQRLDKNDQPIGEEQLARREAFNKSYLLENQINIC